MGALIRQLARRRERYLASDIDNKHLRGKSISRLRLRIFDRLVGLSPRMDGMIPWKPTSNIAVARQPEA